MSCPPSPGPVALTNFAPRFYLFLLYLFLLYLFLLYLFLLEHRPVAVTISLAKVASTLSKHKVCVCARPGWLSTVS
jgi:hypothetical protein